MMSEKRDFVMARMLFSSHWLRVVRWIVVILQQLAYIPFMLLLLLGLFIKAIEPYLDLFLLQCGIVVFAACFANCINGFVLIAEGRISSKWRSLRQLFTLLAISIPIYGIFYYLKCDRELHKSGISTKPLQI